MNENMNKEVHVMTTERMAELRADIAAVHLKHGLQNNFEMRVPVLDVLALLDERDRLHILLRFAAEHVESANHLFAENGDLDEEDERMARNLVDECRDALGLPALAMHFVCEDCGDHVAADEDGCCASCGADCREARCACILAPSDEPPVEAAP